LDKDKEVVHRTQTGGLEDVAMSKNHRLELIGGGMNDEAKQGGIEEFVGPGTGIRR